MKYQGSCHCGKTAFEVEGQLESVMECNCSICRRKGTQLWFVPRTALTLKTPEDALTSYTFNKHAIHHKFCPVCGVTTFAYGNMPDGTPMAAINARCLDDVDLSQLKHNFYNGKDA